MWFNEQHKEQQNNELSHEELEEVDAGDLVISLDEDDGEDGWIESNEWNPTPTEAPDPHRDPEWYITYMKSYISQLKKINPSINTSQAEKLLQKAQEKINSLKTSNKRIQNAFARMRSDNVKPYLEEKHAILDNIIDGEVLWGDGEPIRYSESSKNLARKFREITLQFEWSMDDYLIDQERIRTIGEQPATPTTEKPEEVIATVVEEIEEQESEGERIEREKKLEKLEVDIGTIDWLTLALLFYTQQNDDASSVQQKELAHEQLDIYTRLFKDTSPSGKQQKYAIIQKMANNDDLTPHYKEKFNIIATAYKEIAEKNPDRKIYWYELLATLHDNPDWDILDFSNVAHISTFLEQSKENLRKQITMKWRSSESKALAKRNWGICMVGENLINSINTPESIIKELQEPPHTPKKEKELPPIPDITKVKDPQEKEAIIRKILERKTELMMDDDAMIDIFKAVVYYAMDQLEVRDPADETMKQIMYLEANWWNVHQIADAVNILVHEGWWYSWTQREIMSAALDIYDELIWVNSIGRDSDKRDIHESLETFNRFYEETKSVLEDESTKPWLTEKRTEALAENSIFRCEFANDSYDEPEWYYTQAYWIIKASHYDDLIVLESGSSASEVHETRRDELRNTLDHVLSTYRSSFKDTAIFSLSSDDHPAISEYKTHLNQMLEKFYDMREQAWDHADGNFYLWMLRLVTITKTMINCWSKAYLEAEANREDNAEKYLPMFSLEHISVKLNLDKPHAIAYPVSKDVL